MRRIFWVFLIFGAGVLVGVLLRDVPVVAEGARAAAITVNNGDTDGNGAVELTDAVYILRHLFQAGPAPVACTCDGTPAKVAKIRFLNDILCGQNDITARLTVCDSAVDQLTSDSWSNCVDVAAGAVCPVRITANTACGSICLTTNVPVSEGHVYSFVASVGEDGLFAVWYDREGNCATPPPNPADEFNGIFDVCQAAAAAAAPAAKLTSASGAWGS